MSKILTQDEVNALLNDFEVTEETTSAGVENKTVNVYDFKHPDRVSKDQMRLLKTIHSNFAKSFGTFLSTKLRTTVDISVFSVDQLTYSEFMMTMASPSCIYSVETRLGKGNYIIEFAPEFVFYTIDRLLGGSGEVLDEAREITIIEENILKKIAQRAITQLDSAWQNIASLNSELVNFETNPQFVQIAPASEPSVVISFSIRIHNFSSIITLCFPYFVLEPIMQNLNIQSWISMRSEGSDQEISPFIREKLKKTPVSVIARMDITKIKLADLMQLEKGDVLLFDDKIDNQFRILVAGKAKFKGYAGTYGKHLAVKISHIIQDDEGLDHV